MTWKEVIDRLGNPSEQTEIKEFKVEFPKELETLERSRFFEKVREFANGCIRIPEFQKAAGIGENFGESFLEMVTSNDFSEADKNDPIYAKLLDLARIKNEMVRDIALDYLKHRGDGLGLKPHETVILEYLLQLIPVMDRMYMRWRKELYPAALAKKLTDLLDSETESAFDHLQAQGLSDPYAIVQEAEGKPIAVPYGVAFAEETAEADTLLAGLVMALNGLKEKTENQADIAEIETYIFYFAALQTAFKCEESKKEGDDWLSVKLWKEVDKAWLKTQGRLQLVHSIEAGYGGIDPTETKVIPEFKILLVDESAGGEALEILKKMREENMEVLAPLLPEQVKGRLEVIRLSLVGPFSIVLAGGNSLDNLGIAQMGPNYGDIASMGVKSFLDAASFAETDASRAASIEGVLGIEAAQTYFPYETKHEDLLLAELIASHEISHAVLGDLGTLDEVHATWMGLVALFEREKTGKVEAATVNVILKEHIKYSIKYLSDASHDDRYYIEGAINTKLMLQSGLLARADGKFSLDEKNWGPFKKLIGEHWAEMVRLHAAGGRGLKTFAKNLQKADDAIKEVARLAVEGVQAYNENTKKEILGSK
ncbi:hypothetical protein JXA05_02280 [Candidatus Peregrinibacteria bacterium]|nr:hypothetical protein [Candidatus Peregrinibacteria bacterium]